jgi:hypothetical protein
VNNGMTLALAQENEGEILSMKKLLSLSAFTLLIAACGGPVKDAVVQSINEPRLMSTWESKCTDGGKVLKLSEKTFLRFNGAGFERIQSFYSTDKCGADKPASENSPAAEVRYKGSFLLTNNVIAENGAKLIDYKIEQAKVVALNDAGVKALNEVKLCGHETYQLNQEVDLTSQSAGGTCPLQTAPSVAYEIYKINDGSPSQLQVSQHGWFSGRGETAKDRPKDLDAEFYVPSKRNW